LKSGALNVRNLQCLAYFLTAGAAVYNHTLILVKTTGQTTAEASH